MIKFNQVVGRVMKKLEKCDNLNPPESISLESSDIKAEEQGVNG